MLNTQGHHSHILMTRGPSDFFGSEILAQSDFFWVYERRRDAKKKQRDFFWVAKKGLRDFFWVC